MKYKKTILYLGNFSFPFGNAAGKRVYANGQLFRALGYNVIFIGMDVRSGSGSIRDTRKEYDGFTYFNIPYPKSNIEWVRYKKLFYELRDFLNETSILDDLAFIICYGSPRVSLFNLRLLKFANQRDIKTLVDCVDWLKVRTNNIIFDLSKYFDDLVQKSYVNKKADGLIVISSYLENYYKKHGKKTIIIPPLAQENTFEIRQSFRDVKIITYAGVPFRKGVEIKDPSLLKDRIDFTIKLFFDLKKQGAKFIFKVYGITKEEYIQVIPNHEQYLQELGESIVFYGMKPNEEVVSAFRNSDFTILIRDCTRASMAGFPTKVSESISCGTPVITTKTSDLEKYVLEWKSGFFLDAKNYDYSLAKMKKILDLNDTQIFDMKQFCLRSKMFSYTQFTQDVGNFLESLER